MAAARILADVPGRAEEHRQGAEGRESGHRRGRRSPGVVPGDVRAQRDGGPAETLRLAGYRNGQVFIRKSMHVAVEPGCRSVDAMPAFFDLLREEEHPAVRVVLGHFVSYTSILMTRGAV